MNPNTGEHLPSNSRNVLHGNTSAQHNAQAAAAAAFALRTALTNPYAAGAHYQQQYFQQVAWAQARPMNPAYVTSEGYTISSTYSPSFAPPVSHYPAPARGRGFSARARGAARPSHGHGNSFVSHANVSSQPFRSQDNVSSPHGSSRCTHEACTFAGSAKAVEVHMMDRHLIFPPGWQHKKRKGEWDADPSLNNGKPVPIPGTGITLDTPEAIDAWIAERKKRWPSTQRVQERKQKLQEAVARGDLLVSDPQKRANKRRRLDSGDNDIQRGAGRGRGRGRGSGRGNRGARGTVRGGAPTARQPLPDKPADAPAGSSSSSSEGEPDASSDSDMDPVRDAVSSKRPIAEDPPVDDAADRSPSPVADAPQPAPAKASAQLKRPRQPRPPPRNPFAQRPSLLQNLLMPEIRATISNLSQAIRFVVQNDFFDGVELKPGNAKPALVQMIPDKESDAAAVVATGDTPAS